MYDKTYIQFNINLYYGTEREREWETLGKDMYNKVVSTK